MTCLDLELPHWDFVHKRDRLIGTSVTGWQDAMAELDYTHEQEAQLLNVLEEIVNDEALKYLHDSTHPNATRVHNGEAGRHVVTSCRRRVWRNSPFTCTFLHPTHPHQRK